MLNNQRIVGSWKGSFLKLTLSHFDITASEVRPAKSKCLKVGYHQLWWSIALLSPSKWQFFWYLLRGIHHFCCDLHLSDPRSHLFYSPAVWAWAFFSRQMWVAAKMGFGPHSSTPFSSWGSKLAAKIHVLDWTKWAQQDEHYRSFRSNFFWNSLHCSPATDFKGRRWRSSRPVVVSIPFPEENGADLSCRSEKMDAKRFCITFRLWYVLQWLIPFKRDIEWYLHTSREHIYNNSWMPVSWWIGISINVMNIQ